VNSLVAKSYPPLPYLFLCRIIFLALLFSNAVPRGQNSPFARACEGDFQLQNGEIGQASEGTPQSYADEPLEKLLKQVPELKGIRPATDQQQLPVILSQTGQKVDEFFSNIVDLVADEDIHQGRLDRYTIMGSGTRVRDNYLIVHEENGDFDEFRMDEAGHRLDQGGQRRGFLVTSGFALICAHFSSAFERDSQFRYLGDQTIEKKETYVVAFTQLPMEASLTETMIAPGGVTVHMLIQGIAWIDQNNFHILRMRTDLLGPQREVGLDEQTTKVNFSEVQFADVATPLWLPREVIVYMKLGKNIDRFFEEEFRNVHHYKNYRRYRVSSRMVAPQ
jgi:hypothetical protein